MKPTYTAIFITLYLISCQRHDRPTYELTSNIELEQKMQVLSEQVYSDSTNIIFRLDTLTEFSWDSLLVMTPYTPIEFLERQNGIDLHELNQTKLKVTEGYYTLAFLQRNKLKEFVEIPITIGRFKSYDSTRCYTPKTAVFEMVLTNQKLTNGQLIININPKAESNVFLKFR